MSATITPKPFKDRHTFQERSIESRKILEKFPGRIPIIVERALKDKSTPLIDKNKFLCPGDLTIGQFLFIIRNRMKLPSEKALFVFINDSLPPTNTLIKQVYYQFRQDDGFLYMSYCGESVFGELY